MNTGPTSALISLADLLVPYSDDLTKVHLHVVDLGDEDGRQRFIQSGSVHVDGGAHRQHKTRDSFVNSVVFFQTFKGDRQSGRAAGRGAKNGAMKPSTQYCTSRYVAPVEAVV